MAYTAYERATGNALSFVESLMRYRTSGGTFDTSSTPTLTQVEAFLTTGSARIAGMLMRHGYSATQTDADVLALLEIANSHAAAYQVELMFPAAGALGEESTGRLTELRRWERYLNELLATNALARLGATVANAPSDGLSHGGTSISDKDTIETDSDFEPFIFTKDQFGYPGSVVDDPNLDRES